MKILYLGDYAADAPLRQLAERPPQPLDIDVFDTVMAQLQPTLGRFELTFRSIDDFHPDELLRTGWFADLVGLRSRLAQPGTFAEAAGELRNLLGSAAPTASDAKQPQQPQQPQAAAAEEDSTFARLLNQDSAPVSRRATTPNLKIEKLLQEAVAPFLEPDASPDQAQLLAAVDKLLSMRLREVLHDPQFQALEAAWRWLEETVRRVDASASLKLAVLPVAREELAADPAVLGGELTRSALYETLMTRQADAVGEEPWTYLVADYRFGTTDEDIRVLAYLSALASEAGAQLITGATADLAGCPELADLNAPERWLQPDDPSLEAWQALRRSGLGQTIIAALPRILTRYPYGRKLNPVEFGFEELDDSAAPCLWGNAAYGCAIAVAQAFSEDGWAMDTAAHASLDDLPMWQIDEDGTSTVQPTTEAGLGESAAAALIERGLTPVCPVRGTNEARIFGLHTAAEG